MHENEDQRAKQENDVRQCAQQVSAMLGPEKEHADQ
jgi:hypothetical protein